MSITRVKESPRLHSLADVATMLGVCTRTVRREIQRGRLPRPIRVGSKPMLLASELEECISRKMRERER